jgi:hypothetical protein
MSTYSQIPFDVVDFKNENVLSSFALEETPLTFIPNLNNFSDVTLVWDFGDNTLSKSLTGVKWWSTPGQYLVSLTVFDCFSNALLSTEEKTITIRDFTEHTFTVDHQELDTIEWKNGKINEPFEIRSYFPLNVTPSSLFYNVNGSISNFYFDFDDEKYVHLLPTHCFFEKIYNYKNKEYQYNEIMEIIPTTTKLFAKISGGVVQYCNEDDAGSFYVGLSGYNEVYFKDDLISDTITIDLFFDKYQIPTYVGGTSNNLSTTLSATIIENDDVDHLTITSNGLDGEFYQISSFNIDDYKFSNIKIPFVIKIKDSENFSVKNFSLSSINQFNVSILSSGKPLSSSFYNINKVSLSGGSVLGNVLFLNKSPIQNITVSASGTFVNNLSTPFVLSGASVSFGVYPQDYVIFSKINEDFDFTDMLKKLRFQEFLLDKNILFDDFIGSIFGNIDSSHDTLGKKLHEKISNFVDNNSNIDRSEVNSLLNHMDMLNVKVNEFDSNRFNFPESIKRLIDLASIDKNRLLGTKNKFSQNFDIKSTTTRDVYGRNLGNEINTNTYVISAGTPIVALEKFSGDYILLNTYQPMSSVGSSKYMLSSYSSDWGLPLVLPDQFAYSDVAKYYTFFKYVSGFDNTLTNNTLLSSSIYDTMDFSDILKLSFRDTLYQSLSLVK